LRNVHKLSTVMHTFPSDIFQTCARMHAQVNNVHCNEDYEPRFSAVIVLSEVSLAGPWVHFREQG